LHIGSNLPQKDNLRKADKSSAPKVSFVRRFHCSSLGLSSSKLHTRLQSVIQSTFVVSCSGNANKLLNENGFGLSSSKLHTRLQSVIQSTFVVSCSGNANKLLNEIGFEHCMDALWGKMTVLLIHLYIRWERWPYCRIFS